MKRVIKLLPMLLVWCIANSANAQCPNSLSGYTSLGEFNNSKYFISNTTSTWTTAQSNAAANGGYLASITSQAENDFILSNLNSIVFIGYNDAQSEGNFTWDSGESVGFNKFADTNTGSKDFGKMNHWNGNWGVDGQFVSRKSLVEIPCNGGGSGINITSCPNDITDIIPHGGDYSKVVTWSVPTATTDCNQGGLTITQIEGNPPGSNFFVTTSLGQVIVYEITDACGNSEFCIFDVTLSPAQPVVSCPTNITVTATSSSGAVVTYDAPSVVTFCNAATFQLNQGLPSGSLFPIGTTQINYGSFLSGTVGFCQVMENCNFTVTVNPQGGGSGCPDNISGFTSIGEFGDSKYFLSNTNAQPEAAQATASANGGYLAVINSQSENNFIQQNIDNMTYIGLNDASSEGNLEWVNGESLSYNNVDPCGFCEENSGSKDYVIMAPWDGKWSFSSQFNSRPYVIEVPCDDTPVGNECSFDETIFPGFTGFGSALATLNETSAGYELVSADQLSGLQRKVTEVIVNKSDGSTISISDVENNSEAAFNSYWDRDANELYEATLPSNPSTVVVLKKYGSSNNVIWTQNLNVGFDVYGIADVRMLDDEILITGNSGPTTSIPVIKTTLNGNLTWAINLPEGVEFGTGAIVVDEAVNGGYYIQYTNGGPFVIKLNNSGNKLWKINVGTGDPPSERRYVLGESADGAYFYMANSSFNSFKASFTRFNTTNGNGEGTQLGEGLPLGTTIERSFFAGGIPTNDGGFVVFYDYAPEAFGSTTAYHDRFDSSGNLVWRRETPADIDVDPSSTKLLAAQDGGFIIAERVNNDFRIVRMTSDGYFEPDCSGNGTQPDLTVSNLTNVASDVTVGAVENFNFDLNNIGNATAVNSYVIGAYISTDNTLSSNDLLVGEVPTGNTFVGTDPNVPGSITVPSVANGTYYLILKADINNAINESNENNNTVSTTLNINTSGGCSTINPPVLSGFTFKTSQGSKLYYLSNGTDRPTDAEAKCVSAGGHLATVTSDALIDKLKLHTNGLVYIGLHDENTEGDLEWRSGAPFDFNRFDNCSICEPNTESKDYVVMQGWNGKWSWSGFFNSRKYWLEIDCNNFNPNNTLITLPTVEKEVLDFQKIVPNPASNHIFVQVKSETSMLIDVEVYDARGLLLKSQSADLFDGINAVEIDIADLPGGFYLIKIPQMNGKHSTQRFVKVRE